MREMVQYLRPYWKGLVWATAAIAVSTLCDLLLPTIMSEILNNGVYQRDFGNIVQCCAMMLIVALVEEATYNAMEYALGRIEARIYTSRKSSKGSGKPAPFLQANSGLSRSLSHNIVGNAYMHSAGKCVHFPDLRSKYIILLPYGNRNLLCKSPARINPCPTALIEAT